MNYMWSRNHKNCKNCKRTTIPHKAFGLCKSCYEASKGFRWQLEWQKKDREKRPELVVEKNKVYRKPNSWFRKIADRDGELCRNCGVKEDLTLQHKIPKCIGGNYSYDNLEILCFSCNRKDWNNLVKEALELYFKERGDDIV